MSEGRASVNEIAFSPDSRTLAVADSSSRVKLWEIKAAHVYAEMEGHQAGARSVAFSPDGKLLAAGSQENGQTMLWDTASRRVLATLAGRGTKVAVAFSPDGKTLATAGWDCIVQLWDTRTMAEIASLWGHKFIANTAAYGGRQTLVTGDSSGRVKIQPAHPVDPDLALHLQKGVEWGAFSADGQWIDRTERAEDLLAPGRSLRWDRRLLLQHLKQEADAQAANHTGG
jgi:WD40 repeat protein